jgi:sulfate/thiosulfate transport system ATP-binding protein
MSIILSDLTKRFGRNIVVNRVNLEILDGELFVLLGGSGSGKSTILRLIAGLLTPDEGRIELNGRDVTFLPPQQRGAGFVFQNYSVFRHMTVTQNVEFGLKIRKTSPAERRKRVEQLLDLVGLGGLGTRFADQLSGGQQQRVALARALAYQPDVLLLDEPFSALDVKIRAQLRQSVKEIQHQLKVTTILVTHDQEEAFELADRIGVVDSGRVIEVETPHRLYHFPRSELAASFVGSGNVLAGRREGNRIRLGQVLLPMPGNMPEYEENAPVRILFRPESVLLRADKFRPEDRIHELGQGVIIEQVFAGVLDRMTLAMEALQGARPLMPRPVYGQSEVRIEAVLPSQNEAEYAWKVGDKPWVGLPQFHVLQPSGLKVLVCTDTSPGGRAAADYGYRLAEAAGGPVSLLAVGRDPDEAQALRKYVDDLRSRWLEHLPTVQARIRQGQPANEILQDIREYDHELVVLGRSKSLERRDLGKNSRQVFLSGNVPTLFVTETRPHIRRILICTAAGEPGKADVRFGGRVARRTQAEVKVLHVLRPEAGPDDVERANRHMRQAQAMLMMLGIRAEALLPRGNARDEILWEIDAGDYDLIVLGAPAPRTPNRLVWTDLTIQIITQTTSPVLVVPMLN